MDLQQHVRRTGIVLQPDARRVLLRKLELGSRERVVKIISRVLAESQEKVEKTWQEVCRNFDKRHRNSTEFFQHRFDQLRDYLPTDRRVDKTRQLLIGAYFSLEYTVESAALFNPSIVWHPDQAELPEGHRRFVLSLRATGEGHISSVAFRSGTVDENCWITLNEPSGYVTSPKVAPDAFYDKKLFRSKLFELGLWNPFCSEVLDELGDRFTLGQLTAVVNTTEEQHRQQNQDFTRLGHEILELARSNYAVQYSPSSDLSERLLFPYGPTETNGIEDARFVRFVDDDEQVTYYGTFSAYDGQVVLPQLIETADFLHFRISTLNGSEVGNKGFALFPRKIRGRYYMLSRQDGENVYIMSSDLLHFWHKKQLLARPAYDWEFVQLGNCGSPIETERGWLVLTHGVGPVRSYGIGAFLLDLEKPTRLIGRLKEPLLMANETERNGYVPNVVYSCGGVVHHGYLILPYAMSDESSSIAVVALDPLLDQLEHDGLP